ncbi:MAG: hypothetical protein EP338_13960 [Bacteroidetes bacterium]|nr:MAG: hypothetical protein EP338_13960 [Bacteroidota bacterium]
MKSNWKYLGIPFFLWLMMGCGTVEETLEDPQVISGELILDLKNSVDASAFVKKYKRYEMAQKEMLGKSMNLLLIEFSTKRIGTMEMLEKLRKDQEVEGVQTNKKMQQRN